LLLVLAWQAEPSASDRITLLTKLVALSVIPLGLILVGILLVRRLFKRLREEARTPLAERPSGTSAEAAFAVATFQAVIQRLREQEKELARLHQSERQRAEQLSATIMRNMATGLVILNAQGNITECNPAAKTVLAQGVLVGRNYREVFWPERQQGGAAPALVQNMETCLRTGQTFRRITSTYRAPGGETKVIGIGLSPILAETQVTGLVCLLTDLTEITALQQQVRLKENLAALGEMSAGIAHEFKNSLATISGYAQLITGEEALDGAHEHAARIVAETRFLTQIVADFLNFSRPLSLVACDVSVRGLIEETFAEVISRGNFPPVALELTGQFPNLTGDQTLLRQCFSNLLRNGCEAILETGRAGRITVDGQVEPGDAGPMLRLRFADNGPGIAPENLDKLFIPFFTTKNAGTGLGLALVHKIVVNHNGRIQVSSEPGAGATFTVSLPLNAGAAAAPGGQ
jgi:PAS domain S-box-containing protein